ncbi:immunoglobulin mu heavy chain%2C partial [Xyrichtys novacula]|nr:immunoglobulin mu heavy chain%2C partial [Xyrichtys novacula]
MHWIRQPAGETLQWMGLIYYDASKTVYSSSLQGRIEISRDNSKSMTYLSLPDLKQDDSAVYYCARHPQCLQEEMKLCKNLKVFKPQNTTRGQKSINEGTTMVQNKVKKN